MAFWINAYNAIVLQTVINNYPIRGRRATYPADSIRQIPGAFEQSKHRVAGRSVTLDEIEKTILPEFKEPRVLSGARPRRGRQRPPAQRGVHRRAARRAARRRCSRSSSTSGRCCGSTARRAACR